MLFSITLISVILCHCHQETKLLRLKDFQSVPLKILNFEIKRITTCTAKYVNCAGN